MMCRQNDAMLHHTNNATQATVLRLLLRIVEPNVGIVQRYGTISRLGRRGAMVALSIGRKPSGKGSRRSEGKNGRVEIKVLSQTQLNLHVLCTLLLILRIGETFGFEVSSRMIINSSPTPNIEGTIQASRNVVVKAVIFDLDGTLLDTEGAPVEAYDL